MPPVSWTLSRRFARKAGFGYSVLLAANAAGGVVGGLLLEGRSFLQARARTAIVLTILWCLAIGGFAAVPYYSLALVLLFLAGIFNLVYLTMTQTLV